ncbi:4'-phosphopantetheinyl transferase superfamily protein [Methylomicrobium sp. Wu6]|uniref:4'-phosphopantetheinyl transferase family protein n=1 Tax=Methylomicrobium sp. Wu6 TaxID=3107928 RepID=UPI002DD69168|nr:4'-phosphopantetheinyl transferase superfamily protein [Methylomicrobium sp. Wu6]MEC4747505.1 4'-phosphopantetheinyl transferase superfamily protein [Methylomicrobium sp. Wu6]
MASHTLNIRFGRLAGLPSELPYFWDLLDSDERNRAQGIKKSLKQAQYIETHGRLRIMLGDAVDAAPERLQFGKNEHGKPYLADYPDVAFNLSHTSDRIAVVLSRRCRVGIDIESCKPRTNLAALAAKCFGAEEKSYWLALPETEQLPSFYRFWTRKEAFVKAVGQGINLGLQNCVIDPSHPERMLGVPPSCGLADEWSLYDLEPSDGFCGAVAVDGTIDAVSIGTF